jgi:hypothetical protein
VTKISVEFVLPTVTHVIVDATGYAVQNEVRNRRDHAIRVYLPGIAAWPRAYQREFHEGTEIVSRKISLWLLQFDGYSSVFGTIGCDIFQDSPDNLIMS